MILGRFEGFGLSVLGLNSGVPRLLAVLMFSALRFVPASALVCMKGVERGDVGAFDMAGSVAVLSVGEEELKSAVVVVFEVLKRWELLYDSAEAL